MVTRTNPDTDPDTRLREAWLAAQRAMMLTPDTDPDPRPDTDTKSVDKSSRTRNADPDTGTRTRDANKAPGQRNFVEPAPGPGPQAGHGHRRGSGLSPGLELGNANLSTSVATLTEIANNPEAPASARAQAARTLAEIARAVGPGRTPVEAEHRPVRAMTRAEMLAEIEQIDKLYPPNV